MPEADRNSRPAARATSRIERLDDDVLEHAPPRIGQFIDQARAMGVCTEHLWGSIEADGRISTAAIIVPQPGRTGMVFLSEPRRQREIADLAAVIGAGCAAMPLGRVHLAQALLAPSDDRREAALRRAGFWPLAKLAYMESRPRRMPLPPQPVEGVEFESWREALAPAFIDTLRASYEQTRDCPALRGRRDPHDVLAGHQGVGRFDPAMWWLMRVDGEAAGVCLINAIPQAGCAELVYLGLTPRHRGRGLGRLLLRHALRAAMQRDHGHLTLAVDAANEPAVRLYERLGFHRTGVKRVLVRFLDEPLHDDACGETTRP